MNDITACSCASRKIEDATLTEKLPGGFKRIMLNRPAYACSLPKEAPNGHGIGAMEWFFIYIGPRGATQFLLSTGWYLGDGAQRMRSISDREGPQAYDVGYHAKKPQYEGHTPSDSPCDWIGNGKKPCYYDGSSLRGGAWIKPFLSEGPGFIWKQLKADYEARFGVKA